jgi:hypothetical protein
MSDVVDGQEPDKRDAIGYRSRKNEPERRARHGNPIANNRQQDDHDRDVADHVELAVGNGSGKKSAAGRGLLDYPI